MTAIQQHADSDLAIRDGQSTFTDKQLAALRQLGVGNASNADVAIFFHHCVRTGLDPFARQIYMIERQGKQTIQTGIDGFRLIARRAADNRSGTVGYEDTLWCGPDGAWTDVWLDQSHPAAAKVTVVRDGARFPAVALWTEYVGTKRDGSVTAMWQSKGALMLAKCAEALALRKAFPQDLSGIYTSDEMQASGNPRVIDVAPVESSGRDWLAEAAALDNVEALRELWRECKAWNEMTDEISTFVADLVKAIETVDTEPATADNNPDDDPWTLPAGSATS